jgi:hypothetical protein
MKDVENQKQLAKKEIELVLQKAQQAAAAGSQWITHFNEYVLIYGNQNVLCGIEVMYKFQQQSINK